MDAHVNFKSQAELEQRVDRYYQKYSARRVALATILVGICSIASSLVVYSLTLNEIWAIGCFGVVSLVGINVAMFLIVPPTKQLNSSRKFIMEAMAEPSRIHTVSKAKIKITDGSGKVRTLNKMEKALWEDLLLPHMLKLGQKGVNPAHKRKEEESSLSLTRAELKILEKEKAELKAREQELEGERSRLSSERDNLDRRSEELRNAEEVVIAQLTQIETTEAELAQLRDDIEWRTAQQSGSADAEQIAAIAAKEDELRAKEAELEARKTQMEADRQKLEDQKREFGAEAGQVQPKLRLKKPGTEAEASYELNNKLKEEELEARLKEIEAAAAELEERSRYVQSVEDSLIDRLNALTEREASVEQSEVNAGLRED